MNHPTRRLEFAGLWLFIAAVAAVDTALLVRGGDVSWLVGAKVFSTAAVLAVLGTIYRRRPGRGLAVAWGLAAFQGWLLWYLFA